MYWGGSHYLDANLMASSGSASRVAAGTNVVTNNAGVVYYVGVDHDMHEIYWGGSQYLDADLMASSGSGMQVLPGTSPTADANGDVWYSGTVRPLDDLQWNQLAGCECDGQFRHRRAHRARHEPGRQQ